MSRKILSLVLSVLLVCMPVFSQGTAVAYGEEQAKASGINLITGTSDPVTFEDGKKPDCISFYGVSDFSVVAEGENHILEVIPSGSWPGIVFSSGLSNGTYTITFREKSTKYSRWFYWQGNGAYPDSLTASVWKTYKKVVEITDEVKEIKITHDLNGMDYSAERFYIDDISIVPSPKAGTNVLNYASTPLTFDNDICGVSGLNAEVSTRQNPLSADSSDFSLCVTPTWTYSQAVLPLSDELPAGTYCVSYDAYKLSDAAIADSRNMWVMYGEKSAQSNVSAGYFNVTGVWAHFEVNITSTTPISYLALQWETNLSNDTSELAFFDNIYVTPACNVTYFDSDGTTVLRSENVNAVGGYFTPIVSEDEKTKGIVGWSLNNDNTVSYRVNVTENALSLYAVYLSANKPGINLLTGNQSPYMFDDGAVPSDMQGTGMSIDKSPLSGEAENNVLRSAPTGKYNNVYFMKSVIPAGTYYVSFKAYKTTLSPVYAKYWYLFHHNSDNHYTDLTHYMEFTANEKTWQTRTVLVDSKESIDKIFLQWEKRADDEVAFFDDITITPAYFVTFCDKDESIIRTEYKYISGSSFTPELTDNDKASSIIGWSAQNDGTTDETINVNNEHFTLYAVYDTAVHISLEADKNLLSAVDDFCTVSSTAIRFGGTDGISFAYNVVSGGDTVSLTDNGDGTARVSSKKEGIAKIEYRASTGEVGYLYVLSDYNNTDKVCIISEKNTLDTDGEKLSLEGVFFSSDKKSSELEWSLSDNTIASITADGSGGAALAPSKNGVVTVKASLKTNPDIFDSLDVTIQNQREKVPVYDIKVLFWGASTLQHPPAESLGWTGNWGMAASSIDKDFAHRYIARLEEEFSPCNITYSLLVGPGYDQAASADTNNTYDYTQDSSYISLKTRVSSFKPDLFLVSQTANMNQTLTNPDAAYRAYSEAFDMVYRESPDVFILDQYDGLAHSLFRETLHSRLAELYKDSKFCALHSDLADSKDNFALEWLEKGQPGVAAHYNDTGMDALSLEMFNCTKDYIYSNIEPSAYLYLPDTLTITGQDEITEKGGSITLNALAEPSDATNLVVWSVDNEKVATIDENGVLTAVNNGTVTVSATGKYSKDVVATKQIAVSGQPKTYTVTYCAGTTDTVSGLPDSDGYVLGTHTLSAKIPLRDCYSFVGWGPSENAVQTVSVIDVASDVTVYAIWEKTNGFEFDGDYPESDGFIYGFHIDGGFHACVENGVLSSICTGGEKVRFTSPTLSIENKGYITFALQSAYTDSISTIELTVKSGSESKKYTFDLSGTEKTVYTADISALSGDITGFDIYVNSAPDNGSMFNVSLDYVRFEACASFNSDKKFNSLQTVVGKNAEIICDRTEKDSDVYALAAVYDENGRMTSVKIKKVLKGTSESITIPTDSTTAFMKLYLFGTLESVKPAEIPMTISVNRVEI